MQLSPLNIITQSPFPLHRKRHPMNLSTGCPFIPAHSFLSKRCIFRLLPAITTCTWFGLFLTVTTFLLFPALLKGLSHCSIQLFPKFLRYRKADILINTLPLFIGLFRLIGRHCNKESILPLQQRYIINHKAVLQINSPKSSYVASIPFKWSNFYIEL